MKNSRMVRGIGKINMEVGKMWKRVGLALVAVGLCLTLMLGAAISVCEAGPAEEKVVKIGWYALWSGPLATSLAPAGKGLHDGLKYINEQGGIAGVKLDWMWEDTGRSIIPMAITAHRRFVEGGVVAEISASVDQAEVILNRLQMDEIPLLMATGHTAKLITRPICWVFTGLCTNQDEAAVAAKWFRNKWTKERLPRVGVLIYDHVTGYEFDDGVKWACEHMDMEYTGREVVPVAGLLDSSTEWLRLVGANPDAIFTLTCGATQVVTMKDAARLGVQEKGITLIDCGYCIPEAVRVVGKDANGWYFPRPFRLVEDSEVPGVKKVVGAAKRYERKAGELTSNYMVGWMLVHITAEAIRLAIQKVGYDNLTGRAVRDGFASIKDYDTEGMMGRAGRVSLSDSKPFLATGCWMYEVREGKPLCISDFMEFPGCYKTLLGLEQQ